MKIKDFFELFTRSRSRPFLGTEAYNFAKILSETMPSRISGSIYERSASILISNWFQSMGYRVRIQKFQNPAGNESQNVIASKDGEIPERFLVVGAHYDSVEGTPGANDNASGVGVMLETAMIMAGISAEIPMVYIAFGSEEGSHAGSKHFVSSVNVDSVAGMINLDAVGVEAGMEIGCYGDVDPWLANHCGEAAESSGITLSESHFGGKSDYASFSDSGIPVACFARTDQPTAHTPEDNMGLISHEGIAEIGNALVASLTSLSDKKMKDNQTQSHALPKM